MLCTASQPAMISTGSEAAPIPRRFFQLQRLFAGFSGERVFSALERRAAGSTTSIAGQFRRADRTGKRRDGSSVYKRCMAGQGGWGQGQGPQGWQGQPPQWPQPYQPAKPPEPEAHIRYPGPVGAHWPVDPNVLYGLPARPVVQVAQLSSAQV